MNQKPLIDLLFKMADDQLILGHRNSEWTGIGPMLEEDIAFSSMAQDKVGQSLVFYKWLHELGEQDPDSLAFLRNAPGYHNCQFVELPIGDYDFSLIRHFLFDHAELVRFQMLQESNDDRLAQLARKLFGEIKYHIMHANTFINKLGNSNPETIERLQKSLEYAMPFALGIFEPSQYEPELIDTSIFPGEEALKEKWLHEIDLAISQTQLTMPDIKILSPVLGGRYGTHTEHLQPLLEEMGEVIRADPTAEW